MLRVTFNHDCQRRHEGAHTKLRDISAMANNIRHWSQASIYPHRAIQWQNWYAHSLVTILDDNEVDVCTKCRLSVEDIRLKAAGSPRPWDSNAREAGTKFPENHILTYLRIDLP